MRFYPLEIEVDGKRRRGEWTLLMGGRICVRALGCPSRTVDLDGADPHVLSASVLREMLAERQADPGRFVEPRAPRTPDYPVTVLVEARSWSGRWSLAEREVVVSAAYGVRRAPLKRSTPQRVAERVLKELVAEWRERQQDA